jgi:ribokinase
MIIVFGSLLIDLYIPLDEMPTAGSQVLSGDYTSYPGGKGANQGFAAKRAGAKTAIIGCIGDDAFGRRSTQNLRREGILGSGIGTGERPTGCAVILPGSGEDKTMISSPAANLETRSDQIPNEILDSKNTVVAQLLVPYRETLDLFRRAKERGTRTVLNAAPPQYVTAEILKLTDMLFVNETELKTMASTLKLDADLPIRDLTRLFCENYTLDCVTTLGSRGSYALVGRQGWTIGALPVEVIDANGAGDCFLGYLLGLMDQGYNFTESLHHAAVAGSLACQAQGAQKSVPFLEDVTEKLADLAPPQKV